jgi:hypothetical protein
MQDPEGRDPIVPVTSGIPSKGHIVMLDPEGNEFCLD